jgi:hypothetical protein
LGTAFAIAAALGLALVVSDSGSIGSASRGVLLAVPLYFGFVGLPGAVSLLAARHRGVRIGCALLMTAIGGWAGRAVATTDDAQAGLAVLVVPMVGVPLAGVVFVIEAAVQRRRDSLDSAAGPAAFDERAAAWLIDLVILGAVLTVPLTRLSHADQELVAGAIGITASVAYLATCWMVGGSTIGQRLLRVGVVRIDGTRCGPGRALVRAVALVIEHVVSFVLLFIPLVVEAVFAADWGGRTIVDRLAGTRVMRTGAVQVGRPKV